MNQNRLAVNFCSVCGPCGSEQLRRNFKRLRKLSHSSDMDTCRRERVFQQGSHCLHSRMRSCHFPEKSASLNTSHETGLGVRDPGLPQEKGPAGRLRQGLPFPDISSRISLHYVPSLCRWHVQWKIPEHVEQMPLFLLQRSGRVTFSAPLTRCCWSDGFSDHCFGAFLSTVLTSAAVPSEVRKVGGSTGGNRSLRRPHFCEVGSSAQLWSSHEERGQRGPTDSERKSRS